jgi:Uma2 family endonuclease
MARQPSATLRVDQGDGPIEFDARPLQGSWSEAQYLRLSSQTNRLIELVDGRIEVLSMPTEEHQALLEWLFLQLRAFIVGRGGVVRFAPLRLRIRPSHYREPDILLLRDAEDPRRANDAWGGADLVVEIVSPDDPDRDWRDKRIDYAEAHVEEYWIVDPRAETVTVLVLADDAYAQYGVFGRGGRATSRALAGFGIAVEELFAARPGRR